MKTIKRIPKWPGPKKIAAEFARGNWVGMLADKYKVNDAQIECALMDYIRKYSKQESK